MGPLGLKWWIVRGPGFWSAFPIHSQLLWKIHWVETDFGTLPQPGPADMRHFRTHEEAIAYATDPHHAYLNGWMP